jgi:DNA polymerase-1
MHFRLPYPREWHDTMFLAFLDCPHAPSFALKATAERVLRMPPDNRDVVRDWVLANVPGATPKGWGAYIAQAPVNIVGPYAISDVEMTYGLLCELYPRIVANGMTTAYNREINLMPWLLDAEIRGVRVDRDLLHEWETLFLNGIPKVDEWIRGRLGAPNLNIDEDRSVAEALDRAGLVAEWEYTPSGQRATNKAAMLRQCSDPILLQQLSLRNTAATMLRSFVQPWLAASATDGRLHTQWNSTRSIDNMGTKTGRIGSERPNLANVPNPVEGLPNLRRAFLPDDGEVWLKADYSQQEFRLTAHFENGAIMQAYQNDPNIDFHALTSDLVKLQTGLDLPRKKIKNVNFCLLYGGGVKRLSAVLGCAMEEAAAVRDAYYAAMPGLHRLSMLVQQKSLGPAGGIRTAGGRFMPIEPARLDPKTGEMQTYGYKMLNKLCQGSAADMTKQAIVDFSMAGTKGKMLLQVYDELDISVPKESLGAIASTLNECMVNAMPLDVPMKVDMEIGPSWGELMPVTI